MNVATEGRAGVQPQVNWGDGRFDESVWLRVSPCPVTSCWWWTGPADEYGPWFTHKGKTRRVRRIFYSVFVGPLKYQQKITSDCDVGCCNPAHIRPRTNWTPEHKRRYIAEYSKRRHAERPWEARDRWLRGEYGISLKQFDDMLVTQGGVCALCPRKLDEKLRRDGSPKRNTGARVDHIHGTRRVRDLLCHVCNIGLGNFGDSPERLRAAADYIERHAAKAAS